MSTACVASVALVVGAGGVDDFGVAGVHATSVSGLPNGSRAGGAGFGGFVLTLEDRSFDAAQAAHLTPHLNLGVTVSLQNRLGNITQKVIVAIAVRYAWEFRRNRRHERILLVRD